MESFNSDGVGGTNFAEIQGGTQPGWCVATTAGCNNNGVTTLPAGVANLPLDPAAQNVPPVANAGPNQATQQVGQTVQLNGSASTDPELHLLTYSWTLPTRPTGSTATLTNPTAVNPTFTPDVAGAYTARLVVNDGTQNSAPASVTITAAPAPNLPPVANAGPNQAVAVGQLVTLSGSASTDPERHLLTYSWTLPTRPTGSTATLTNPTAVNPTFTPDVAGSYTVRLIVNDGTQNSPTATATISAAAQNLAPVANAGPDQAVNVGQLVTLNGSASSDPERQPLTYSWSFVSRPAGSTATLTNPTTVNPTFAPDAAGNFVVQLIVRDGALNSPADSVIIAATASNLRPTANAGSNQAVNLGQLVTLNGSASSDPESQSLTYSWSFVSRPAGSTATLTNPTTVNPTFAPAVAGQYVVGLVVGDGMLNSTNTANVTITVQASTPTSVCTMTVNPTALAFGSVNLGSSKAMTTTIRNTGTANCTVSSLTVSGAGFALGSGAPSVGATIAPNATLSVPVNVSFAPTVAGAASGRLTIGSAVVSLSGTGVPVTTPTGGTGGAVDLNIVRFRATDEVELGEGKSVRFQLVVKNVSKVTGSAPATLVGMRNGVEVYRQALNVSAPVGKVGTFAFLPYTPTAAGKIKWTVTIQDQGPARNMATATTEVEGEDKEEREHSDRKRS